MPTTLHQVYGEELAELLDIVSAGEVVADRATAERLIRCLGALLRLHQRHQLDDRGQCELCWTLRHRRWWRPWPKRSACTVHTALSFYLRQPTKVVLTTLAQRRAP